MLFNSVDFIIFFPIVVLFCFLLPKKFQRIWLLLASYFFYMSWNPKYIALILFTTVVTFIGGIGLDRLNKDSISRRICFISSISANFLLLFFFKYADMMFGYLNKILEMFHIEMLEKNFSYELPVGISFFTFQAVGYVIDVYRGETKAERRFISYALFIAFFPQLVAGPIERSKNLLRQVNATYQFDYERVKNGLLLMLWGFFLKLVVADRIAIFVDAVYENPYGNNGFFIVLATALFGFQIYCDFSGYSTIARGGGKVLGYELMENFKAPYLALNVSEFWRRWHISLTGWFRDYLYIPLGGNRKGKLRQYINLMVVFLASGLWHGASLSFVIWGAFNGIYQIISDVCTPLKKRVAKLLTGGEIRWEHRLLCRLGTFLLIDFTWLFFRAGSIKSAVIICQQMFNVYNPWIFFSGALYEVGLNQREFWFMLVAIVIVLWVDNLHYHNVHVLESLQKRGLLFRTLAISGLIFMVVMFGVYGENQDVGKFIYFTF